MSEQLTVCLIAIASNLGGMLLIYLLLAFTLVRLAWHGRGVSSVIVALVVAGLFWIVPTTLAFGVSNVATPASYAIWFGNWLVTGFSVVLLSFTAGRIPRELEDSARLDGIGPLGIFWHIVLPLVRRELGLIAVLTLIATSTPVLISMAPSLATPLPSGFASLTASLALTLPVVAIFLIGKTYLVRKPQSRIRVPDAPLAKT